MTPAPPCSTPTAERKRVTMHDTLTFRSSRYPAPCQRSSSRVPVCSPVLPASSCYSFPECGSRPRSCSSRVRMRPQPQAKHHRAALVNCRPELIRKLDSILGHVQHNRWSCPRVPSAELLILFVVKAERVIDTINT